MTIHEFGKENNETIAMLHPVAVWWDIFEYVIPELEKDYHLVIPAMPGHDPDVPLRDYSSVEDIADELADWLESNGYDHVRCMYGCSMGGAVVMRMLADGRIQTDTAIIDGGITPYRLPKPVTYLIGIRDFMMTYSGKYLSIKALSSVFDPDKYTEEDLMYVKKVLDSMSARTIWRGFYSANNYSMPAHTVRTNAHVEYWYGEDEQHARKWDIEYVKKKFPNTTFRENAGQDHAELFTLHPEDFCRALKGAIEWAS